MAIPWPYHTPWGHLQLLTRLSPAKLSRQSCRRNLSQVHWNSSTRDGYLQQGTKDNPSAMTNQLQSSMYCTICERKEKPEKNHEHLKLSQVLNENVWLRNGGHKHGFHTSYSISFIDFHALTSSSQIRSSQPAKLRLTLQQGYSCN